VRGAVRAVYSPLARRRTGDRRQSAQAAFRASHDRMLAASARGWT
jgi:hypothetical protein